jgi:hypothetical protein
MILQSIKLSQAIKLSAFLVLAVSFPAGCGGKTKGSTCNANDNCIDAATNGQEAGTDPDGGQTGDGTVDAASPADGGADAAPVADGGTDGATGQDGGTSLVRFCSGDPNDCGPGEICFQAIVTCGSTDGFCVPANNDWCGGFVGRLCPSNLVCVMENPGCGGADLTGQCMTAAQKVEICTHQPALWNCP